MLFSSAITTKVRNRFQSSSQTSFSARGIIREIYVLYFHYLFAQYCRKGNHDFRTAPQSVSPTRKCAVIQRTKEQKVS